MDKIYILSQADADMFRALSSEISAAFTDFEIQHSIEEDGERTMIWAPRIWSESQGARIVLELPHDKGDIIFTVPDEERFTAFAESHGMKMQRASRTTLFNSVLGAIGSGLPAPTKDRIAKFMIVPAMLLLPFAAVAGSLLETIGYTIISIPLVTWALVKTGGLLLIPAAYISFGLIKRGVKLWRLPLSIWCVFPLISFFFMSIGEDIDFAYLFILPFYYIFLGIFAYIYLFPLIVCDDLLRAAHDTETGTKESVGSRLGYWSVTAAFLILLAVILGCVAASDVTVRDQLKRAEFDSYSSAMAEKQAKGAAHIRADAGLDIADVMGYTYEHQVTDWTYCPDESMEGQWSRLFSNDAEIRAYSHIRDNGGSYEMTVVYDGYGYTISTGDRGLTINSSYYREDENGQQIEYTAPYPEDERRRSLW